MRDNYDGQGKSADQEMHDTMTMLAGVIVFGSAAIVGIIGVLIYVL